MNHLRNLAFLSLVVGTLQCSKHEEKPNIIFILIDDMSWADPACYGSEFYETPNIDRLAEDGMRFTDAYAACPVCSPTRAAILTGKYPARVNLTDYLYGRANRPYQPMLMPRDVDHLPFEDSTLAEVLKNHGYVTAMIGKWHLGDTFSYPRHHGFDINIGGYKRGYPPSYYHPYVNPENPSNPEIPTLDGGEEGDYLTDRLTEEALQFIENNRREPFFLYFSHYAVHSPIQGRPDLVLKYEGKKKKMDLIPGPDYVLEENPADPRAPYSDAEKDSMMQLSKYKGYGYLPNRVTKIKQKQDNVHYAAMVESVDESVGQIMEKLRKLKLDDNTIIIFTADNGGLASPDPHATSNLPLRGAKGWLYEGGIREPLIIKWPDKTEAGSLSDFPVTSTDYYPTILEMAGLDPLPEQHRDGVSIVPVLKRSGDLNREELFWHWPHYSNHGQQSPASVIRSGDYKLIEYHEGGVIQLFNLEEDIGEQVNLADSLPGLADSLRVRLHRWHKEVNARMPVPNPDYEPGPENSFRRW